MMTQAFYSGISGIKAHSSGINAVSDNLANLSTIGYRGYEMEFAPLFEDMLNTPQTKSIDSSVGVGVRVQTTATKHNTGSLMLTDRSTDLAIEGDGWFGIKREGDTLYTRNGAFGFDENDNLVTEDRFHVLGTMGGNISGNILTKALDEIVLGDVSTQEKLRFPKALTYPPEPTTKASFFANLGVEDVPRVISASIVNSEGKRNKLTLEFAKSAHQVLPGSQWDVKATTMSLDGHTIYDSKTGVVSFNSSGGLVSSTLKSIGNNGSSIELDLGKDFSGVVAIDVPVVGNGSSVANGTVGGELRGYDINKNGEVIATFTNGKQSSVGRIAIYHFANNQGLSRISGTKFHPTQNSGDAFFFKDKNGQNIIGTDIDNFKLEGSNYSIDVGLTQLIILQRAFDANSKSITTADEMIQKALSMDA
jgi:flagellar hook protein FlgE